jgi:hypothetical protein
MIRALVSIDADLASSIALRYTCQLAKLMEVEIQTIHIHEPEKAGAGGAVMGAGWARHTYEKELIETASKGISQLLTAESGFCPVLNKPIILSGDREKEILDTLRKGSYDLFVEGMPVGFSSKTLGKLLKGGLYHHLPVPALLVPNLFPLKRLLLLIGDDKDYETLYGTLASLFKGIELEVDLLFHDAKPASEPESLKASAEKVAERHGWGILRVEVMPDDLELMAREAGDCGLVATLFERNPKGKSYTGPLMDFLSRTSCPILFSWR